MTIQVLISTMHQTDYSLLKKMNIQCDAIVINQCDRNEIEEFDYKGNKILWMSLKERGVGLSRNTAFMRATADIVLFADDDVVYDDGFVDKLISAFDNNKKYDIITFNLVSLNPNRYEFIDLKSHRLHWYNSLKYGAFRIAVKREKLLKTNLFFSLLYGGGTMHQAGEDNLFINKALQSGLNVLASNQIVGTVAQEESTWFNGYDEKYYYDRGFLFANIYGKKARLILFLFELRQVRKKLGFGFRRNLKLEIKGFKDFFNKKDDK